MTRSRALLASLFLWCFAAAPALAQSSPGWTFGYVPTVAQWNAVFAAKQDLLTGPPLLTTGGQMTGPLVTAPSTTVQAGFNIPQGVAPTSPFNGDMWVTSASIFARINGSNVDLINTPCATCALTNTANTFTAGPQTITPPAQTTTQGLSITQSGPITGNSNAQINFNSIDITSDQANTGSTSNTVNGLSLNLFSGGSNAQGARQGGLFQVIRTAPTNSANPNRNFVGLVSVCTDGGDGGTGVTVLTAKGSCFGGNDVAQSSGLNTSALTGREVDVALLNGTAVYRWGLSAVSLPNTQAAVLDSAFIIGASGGSGALGWKNGLVVTDANSGGTIAPISSNGCVVCTSFTGGPYTITTGIDLSALTISGNLLSGPGHAIDIAGNGFINMNGNPFLSWTGTTTPYNQITDTNGNGAIILGGGGGTPDHSSYYRNTSHVFGNIGGATTFATVDASGILDVNIAAPSTPASGKVRIWTDSTDLRLHDKSSAGTIGTTVVADTGASNNFLTAISAAGVISKAQPAFSNLSGSATCGQLPALTGDVTTSAGGCATTLATAQPAVHTWALAQTFTVAPVFTDQSGSRTALGLGTMATQAASSVAITGGTIAGLTGLAVRDTSAAFDVTIAATSGTALTAGRTLTLNMGNVAHTLAFGTTANTITFPNAASDTVAMLAVSNTFTGNNAFSPSSGNNITMGGNSQPAFVFNPSTGATKSGEVYQQGDIFRFAAAGVGDKLTIDLGTGQVSAVINIASTSTSTGSIISAGGIGAVGAIYGGAEITTGTTVVASLPTCNSAHKGARHFVTDANATFTAGIGAAVVGSGANNVPVTCDGTNWRIGANDNVPEYLRRNYA